MFLGGIFGGNQGPMNSFNSVLPWLWNMTGQASGDISNAYKQAKGEYATNYYNPYSSAGQSALQMYQNALGLNGATGNAAATSAFQSSPGYQFQLGQGLQALDRSAAAKGLLGSGNALTAAEQYGQGLANQDYGNWLGRLSGLGSQGLQAAFGQTGRQGSLANLDVGQGTALANLLMNSTNNAMGMFNNANQQQNQMNQQGAQNLLSLILGGVNLGSKFL